MTEQVTETFYLPDELEREASRLPADIYNSAHNLLARSEFNCVFVPIRSLQAFGVITENEIVFVDSLTYYHQDNEGGRVIQLAWQFNHGHDRDSLDDPLEFDIVYYRKEGKNMQARMVMEFRAALENIDKHYRDEELPRNGARIVSLKQDSSQAG